MTSSGCPDVTPAQAFVRVVTNGVDIDEILQVIRSGQHLFANLVHVVVLWSVFVVVLDDTVQDSGQRGGEVVDVEPGVDDRLAGFEH